MRASSTVMTVAAASLLVSAAVGYSAAGDSADGSRADEPASPASPVSVSVDPQQLELTAGMPCLPGPPLNVGLANDGDEAVFADAFLDAEEPLALSRGMFSTYLSPGQELTVPVTIKPPYGTEPGTYEVTAELKDRLPRGEKVSATVDVQAPPEPPPGANLLLGQRATPSSTYVTASTEFNPCGAVDGDRTWSHETAWSSAGRGVFPDSYTVTLPEPATMNRIDLHTSDRPDSEGLRDWDVLVEVDGQWRTVAQVRGNTQRHVSSTFERVEATGVRIVAHAANDDAYARISELGAFDDGPVSMSAEASPPFAFYPGDSSQVRAKLTNITDEPHSGAVSLDVPDGWTVEPAQRPYELGPGEQGTVSFAVTTAPDAERSSDYEVVATFAGSDRQAMLNLPVRDGVLYAQDGAPWYAETGGWSSSSLPGHDGTASRYSHNAEGGSGATATWTAQLEHAGTYRVHVWYPTNDTTTTAASYTVAHADGTSERTVNQRENADTWNLLGEWEFEPGAAAVTLTSAATGHHRANAVWFEPVG